MNAERGLVIRHVGHDLRRERGVNAAIVGMIVLSACLMASGAMVMERLVGAIDALLEQAQPPHFLQMHKGDYDVDALARFAAQHPEIDSWFVEEMIGFDGGAISWVRSGTGEVGDLSDSMIDNLFVSQNTEFDFLLDTDGGVPQPGPGELYLPVAYQQRYGLEVGDAVAVSTDAGAHELTIAGFVRDAQMASSLSSATRFLVSEEDLAALASAGGGASEIIVEYLLTDPALAGDLERAYTADPTLPMNGQGVTIAMIRTIHALSDGLAAIALMLLALLLVAIALLNVRFVIRGRLEDDVRRIGTMKAIGIPDRDIARLYLATYAVLTAIGCAGGGVLALMLVPPLMRGAEVSYAASGFGIGTALVLVAALAVVAVVVIGDCRRVLSRVRRVPVVDAIVHGTMLGERQAAGRARGGARRFGDSALATTSGKRLGLRLVMIDLRADARQWVLVPTVFALAAVLMALPVHLLTTLTSPGFVTYLGAPQADVRIDLQDPEALESRHAELTAALAADSRVTDVRVFGRTQIEADTDGDWQSLRVERGDYATSEIAYTHGQAPEPGEIALSVLQAEDLGLAAGDEIRVRIEDVVSTAVVSGIYADVTSGGFTAKMAGDPTVGATGYVLYLDLLDGLDPVALAAEYSELDGVAAVPMREYVEQTMSHMTSALRATAVLAAVLGLAVAAAITAAFLQLRLTRERRTMGSLSAIGFSSAEILGQLRARALVGIVAGTVVGTIAAIVLGGPLVSVLIESAGLGLANLRLVPDPALTLIYPLVLVAAGLLAAVVATARQRSADTSVWLRA